ncbi:hypothetical protein BDFB_010188, partial [Asbolus verrucosus]
MNGMVFVQVRNFLLVAYLEISQMSVTDQVMQVLRDLQVLHLVFLKQDQFKLQEQHFYIDAGINLPREKIDIGLERINNIDVCEISEKVEQKLKLDPPITSHDDISMIPTVSVENIDIETMSESDLKKLETSTTNITDDVKVNLRKRNKKSSNKIITPKNLTSQPKESSCTNLKCKRYSSVLPASYMDNSITNNAVKRKSLNRRSLNIGVGDISKIPVCLKKSKSNVDVKNETKYGDGCKTNIKSSNIISRQPEGVNCGKNNDKIIFVSKTRSKERPKSEILLNTNGQVNSVSLSESNIGNMANPSSSTVNDSIKNKVSITNSIKDNVSKPSGLPILKRRTVSEAR